MTEHTHNPLIARVRMPGQRFVLPSGGLFYNNGELDESSINGEIEVKPMTMIDDLVLKTPDKLLNGDGAVDVIGRCVPQVLKPWEMLSKDIDFIIVCLRLVTYGNLIEIEHTHETCPHVVEDKEGDKVRLARTYKVDVAAILQQAVPIDPTTLDKVYTVTLSNGQICKLRPMRYRSFIDVMQTQLEELAEMPPEVSLKKMFDMLVDIIISVDDVSDRAMIVEWLNATPPSLVSELNEKMTGTFNWGPDMTATVNCEDCGETMELVIPLDPLSFFS